MGKRLMSSFLTHSVCGGVFKQVAPLNRARQQACTLFCATLGLGLLLRYLVISSAKIRRHILARRPRFHTKVTKFPVYLA